MRNLRDPRFDIIVHDGVYPPSEDTFLLIDALEISPEDIILEVGCGSGIVSLHVALVARKVIVTDISLKAILNARENILLNQMLHKCTLLQTNLMGAINLSKTIDVIIFNPPYLPDDGYQSDIDSVTVGGTEGYELTIKLLEQLDSFCGTIYLVMSSLADVGVIKSKLGDMGFDFEIIAEEQYFFERLAVVRGIKGP